MVIRPNLNNYTTLKQNKMKIPITLIFIDEEENHQNAKKTTLADSLFEKVECFPTFEKLEQYLDATENQHKEIILFIHVFRNDNLKGHRHKNRHLIKDKYPNLKIHWVTGDDALDTGEKINALYDTFTYYDIPDLVADRTIVPVKVSEIIKRNNGEVFSNYIFISHSSKDNSLIDSFFKNVLKLGMDISRKQVFYTSPKPN